MTELLDLAVKAHGGLDRWNKVKAIKVAASITGGIWYVKSKGDFLKNVVSTDANARSELSNAQSPAKRSLRLALPGMSIASPKTDLMHRWQA